MWSVTLPTKASNTYSMTDTSTAYNLTKHKWRIDGVKEKYSV